MTRGFSLYLDLLRFGAAMVVLLSHFAYPRFSEGRWLWVRDLNLGSDAVVVFFVLSGLVIAHSTQTKPGGAAQYMFDRYTRLISVALPALLLGYVLDRYGAQIAPHLYAGWYNPLALWELLVRGLTFSSEWSGMATRLGTNGPYWSLSYEAAYYMLFAIAIYTQGVRRIALLLLGGWIVGLNILLLLPAWLMGVAVQRCLSGGLALRKPAAFALAIAPILAYCFALAWGLPDLLRAPIAAYDTALRFSDEFVWNTLLAGLVACHLQGVAALRNAGPSEVSAARIRWLAAGSFSLYLVHYPILQVLAALGLSGRDLAGDVVLFGLTVLACFAFAEVTERRLSLLRLGLQRLGLAPRPHAPHPSTADAGLRTAERA